MVTEEAAYLSHRQRSALVRVCIAFKHLDAKRLQVRVVQNPSKQYNNNNRLTLAIITKIDDITNAVRISDNNSTLFDVIPLHMMIAEHKEGWVLLSKEF